jgi:LPS-assembly lipoprotein
MNTRNVSLPRRGFLLGLTAAGASLGLAGCGFELRKAPVFAFKTLQVSGNSAMINQIRRELRATGTVTVVTPEPSVGGGPAPASTADVVLEILSEDRNRIVISTNSAGLVRELQLQLKVRFRLRTPGGKDLLPATDVSQTRDLSFNETNALAKEGEADLLFRDMQSDIAQQLMRRLAAVKEL